MLVIIFFSSFRLVLLCFFIIRMMTVVLRGRGVRGRGVRGRGVRGRGVSGGVGVGLGILCRSVGGLSIIVGGFGAVVGGSLIRFLVSMIQI